IDLRLLDGVGLGRAAEGWDQDGIPSIGFRQRDHLEANLDVECDRMAVVGQCRGGRDLSIACLCCHINLLHFAPPLVSSSSIRSNSAILTYEDLLKPYRLAHVSSRS